MKKLLVVLLLGVIWAGRSEAAGPTRGAKGMSVINYSATVSSTSIPGPAVVYSVIMSTGATGDFVALFDTSSVTGITAALTSSVLRTRCLAGSTLAVTMCNYDPPLQFNLGVAAILSTAAGQATIVYEKGRVTQGY